MGQISIPGALFVSMIFILSTLFYHLQKRQQAHRPGRCAPFRPLGDFMFHYTKKEKMYP